jgi:hypothetical protein
VLERLVLHEFYHLAGGEDNRYDKGIADPYLRYNPSEEQLRFIRKGLHNLEEELYKKD